MLKLNKTVCAMSGMRRIVCMLEYKVFAARVFTKPGLWTGPWTYSYSGYNQLVSL